MDHLRRLYNRQSGQSSRAFVNAEARRVAKTFEIWRMSTFPRIHRGSITSLDIDELYGQFLLAASSDSLVRVHNILRPSMETSSKFKRDEIYRYRSMRCHHEDVEHIQWYPRSIQAFTSSGLDGIVKLWSTETMQTVANYDPCTLHRSRIFQHSQSRVSRSPLVAVATTEASIPVLDLRQKCIAMRLPGLFHQVYACEWSKTDRHVLASGGSDGRLRLWDIRNTTTPCVIYATHPTRPINRFRKEPTGRAHTDRINGLKFTSDGNTLISYSTENTIKMWDVYGGGQRDANCGVVLNRGRYHMQFDVNHTNHPSLAFIPAQNQILVIKVNTGEVVKTLRGHFSAIQAVTYNPFFEELYSGANDRNIIVWKPHQEQVEALQSRINRFGR